MLGPLTYTWHDPKFWISVPPYAVSFQVGVDCKTLGLSWFIHGLGYDVGFCTRVYLAQCTCLFSFGLSARQTSKMAFLFTGDNELVEGVALIGPPKKRDHRMTDYGQVLIHLRQD